MKEQTEEISYKMRYMINKWWINDTYLHMNSPMFHLPAPGTTVYNNLYHFILFL